MGAPVAATDVAQALRPGIRSSFVTDTASAHATRDAVIRRLREPYGGRTRRLVDEIKIAARGQVSFPLRGLTDNLLSHPPIRTSISKL
jgi:hypothetical protein